MKNTVNMKSKDDMEKKAANRRMRFTALLLASILAAVMLGGCGSGPKDGGGEEGAQAVEAPAPGADASGAGTQDPAPSEEAGEAAAGEENLGYFVARPASGVLDLHQIGMTLELPEGLREKQDRIGASFYVDNNQGSLQFFMVDEEDADNTELAFTELIGTREPHGLEEYVDDEIGLHLDALKDLGTNGTFHYVGICYDRILESEPESFEEKCIPADLDDEKKKEYLELVSHSSEILDNIRLTDLVIPEAPRAAQMEGGELMKMAVTDLDGKEVKLADLISENKVTMLNFWGTFCGPCIREMPGLGELERKYKDQGFEILGMTSDIVDAKGNYDDDLIEDAKDIVADTKVAYPILVTSRELLDYGKFTAFPTTYFVDSAGNMLMEPIVGSKAESQWEEIITELLEKAGR